MSGWAWALVACYTLAGLTVGIESHVYVGRLDARGAAAIAVAALAWPLVTVCWLGQEVADAMRSRRRRGAGAR